VLQGHKLVLAIRRQVQDHFIVRVFQIDQNVNQVFDYLLAKDVLGAQEQEHECLALVADL